MKTVMLAFLSAVMGGLMVVWLQSGTPEAVLNAQEGAGTTPPFTPPGPKLPKHGSNEGFLSESVMQDRNSVEEEINIDVYERVNRSVANITTRTVKTDGFFLLEVPDEGTGSGSVIDKAGHILTNFHVIEDAREVMVTLHNNETYEAAFVGADPVNDIAVIRIEAPPEVLEPVRFGDSRPLKVGMRVFAIGNPFGFERTLSTGIVSSLNRSLQVRGNRTIKSIIQIDAAVNPGNSGGPLLDKNARLIGMNTAIASRTGQSAGVGFAIPSNLIQRVVPELIEHGRVIRPEIGITQVVETDEGLLIVKLAAGGPAEQAGLRGPRIVRERRGPFLIERIDRNAADMIVAVDGKPVKSVDEFLGDIETRRPGDTVVITVIREGRRANVPVRLGGGEAERRPGSVPS